MPTKIKSKPDTSSEYKWAAELATAFADRSERAARALRIERNFLAAVILAGATVWAWRSR